MKVQIEADRFCLKALNLRLLSVKASIFYWFICSQKIIALSDIIGQYLGIQNANRVCIQACICELTSETPKYPMTQRRHIKVK